MPKPVSGTGFPGMLRSRPEITSRESSCNHAVPDAARFDVVQTIVGGDVVQTIVGGAGATENMVAGAAACPMATVGHAGQRRVCALPRH